MIDTLAFAAASITPLQSQPEATKMALPKLSPKPGPEERAAYAEALYRERIRPTLTDADIGRFIIIDVNSGEYEIDDDDAQASRRLHLRMPGAFGYGIRVGYTAAYFFGGCHEEPNL